MIVSGSRARARQPRRITGWGGRPFGAKRGNGGKELSAMANRGHTDVDQVALHAETRQAISFGLHAIGRATAVETARAADLIAGSG
jgi:hypothetical protein